MIHRVSLHIYQTYPPPSRQGNACCEYYCLTFEQHQALTLLIAKRNQKTYTLSIYLSLVVCVRDGINSCHHHLFGKSRTLREYNTITLNIWELDRMVCTSIVHNINKYYYFYLPINLGAPTHKIVSHQLLHH